VLLTATTPVELEAERRDVLFEVLASARLAAQRAEPAELPFRVDEAPPLRIVRSGRDSIVLSDPAPVNGRVAPLLVVGASRAPVDTDDLAGFARARLEETAQIDDVAVDSEAPRALGALPGLELAARARDAESRRAVRVHQILAVEGTRYYLVQGIFDAEDDARLAPAFEAVAASFALREAPAATAGRTAPASQ
jgi:hypothetical protein